jgi:hypothetical protein
MATPKDALYKQRQVEFRKLNKQKLVVNQHGSVVIVPIVHKQKYTGVNGR